MKNIYLSVLFAVLFTGCSSSLGSMELKGTIQASKTNDEDRAIDGFIFDGQNEYYLVDGPAKEKLLEQIDAKVRVKGEVSETMFSGKKYIDIDSYKIVERVN